MKAPFPQVLYGLLFFVLAGCHAIAGAAQEGVAPLNLGEEVGVLAEARFRLPAQAKTLWERDDGLPHPDDLQFPAKAAGFAAAHPVSPADHQGPSLWDVEKTASRQLKCLAYLADGKQDARRPIADLCARQVTRLQWALPIRTGHRRSPDRGFYAAAASLTLTGTLVRNGAPEDSAASEVAAQWLRTGMGQLATYGGKGDESLRRAAEAITDVARPQPEALEMHVGDRDFFTQMDLSRPEMGEVARHVAAADWRQAKQAYVEVLARRFSSKRGWPNINFLGPVDVAEADDICRNVFVIRAHMHRRYDFGKEVDWAKVIDNDIESRVWMNHHPWATTLAGAYQETGDEKYVGHLWRLFNSWYETSPPTFRRSSAQWRTLEVGGRPGQRWGVVLLALAEHPVFKRECLFNMARSMLDHAEYLSMYAAGGGNWLQVESSGLACVALLFPEFKLSPLFYETAMHRLVWVNAKAFLPDGFQSECSPGYHYFPLRGIASAMRLANFLHAPVPDTLRKQYEAGVEVLQYISYPDQTLPMLSDWNPHRTSAIGVLETGGEVFGREDFRWLATGGRQGKPPAEASHDFTHAGYCVMRDKWGPDGQVLIFDAGYFGSGHQHEDKLSFVYYAGGRELIGDPGIYSYKRDEFEPYWRGTWSHNTIVIDGLSQHRSLGPTERIPDPDRRFVIGDRFDFAVGWYRRAYSPRDAALWGGNTKSDRAATIRNVQHQRCIFYAKGGYAIVCDRVLGEGEHQIEILFHPAPVITGEGVDRTARAVKLEVRPDGAVVTKEPAHANVAILPAQRDNLEVLDLIGRKAPVRGWFALYAIVPSHDIVYRCRSKLPRHFETVVEPLPAGDTPPMEVQALEVNSEDGKTCAGLSCGVDRFLISYDGPTEMACGQIHFHGTALLLRSDGTGRPVQAHMVDGKRLRLGVEEVFSAEAPRPARSINLR
jgi:hypothetical protein